MKHLPLLDIYLSTGKLSLLAGNGISLHSLLLLQMGRDMLAGQFLDLKARAPLSVVLADFVSTKHGIERVLTELDCDIPCWTACASPNWLKSSSPQAHIEETFLAAEPLWAPGSQDSRLLLIRGMHRFYPKNPNFHNEVSEVVRTFEAAARSAGCAILGTIGTANKGQRPQELAPRDRVFGSSAWTDNAQDVFVLDFPDASFSTNARKLYLTSEGAKMRAYTLTYQEGAGFDCSFGSGGDSLIDRLYGLFSSLPANKELSRQQIRFTLNPDFQVSDASWTRWISHAVSTGALVRTGKGSYLKPPKATIH